MKLNEFFWHNGYCVIRNFISEPEYLSILPEDLYTERHIEYLYDGTLEGDYKEEAQVKGSYSRTCFPPLKEFHMQMRNQIQKFILPPHQLHPTFYFDRIYYAGTELESHIDWEPCEISVTLQLRTTLSKPWKLFIERKSGGVSEIELQNGDAVIYLGNKVRHWREPMPGGPKDYHHQLFLHYVVYQGEAFKELQDCGYLQGV
jgi:hypothetical protein